MKPTLKPTLKRTFVFACLALTASAGLAGAQSPQPYAGLQARAVKALSDEQIADLKAGRGMGLAMAAELNGYPGPSHVLELHKELGLNESQRARVQDLFNAMKTETVPLGERLIAQETGLDRQFAARAMTLETLTSLIEAIGASQAKLRVAHLKYHLAMLDILTPEQISRYGALRGYAAGAPAGHSPGMHNRAN